MSNAQIANKIKQICKEKNITISQLLEKCEIRKSLIYDLEKRDYTPSITIINVIADYLNVSVDYLLGRTESPDAKIENIHYSNIINGTNGSNSPMTVPEQKKQDKMTDEFMQLFQSLEIADKIAVMNLALEKSKK